MMVHNSLANYYKLMFELTQQKLYTISEVENMLPYELQLYVDMIINRRQELENKGTT